MVNAEVLLGDVGVGSPDDHLVDELWVPGCQHQTCDSSVAPPQQREPAEAQCLARRWIKSTEQH